MIVVRIRDGLYGASIKMNDGVHVGQVWATGERAPDETRLGLSAPPQDGVVCRLTVALEWNFTQATIQETD